MSSRNYAGYKVGGKCFGRKGGRLIDREQDKSATYRMLRKIGVKQRDAIRLANMGTFEEVRAVVLDVLKSKKEED